MIERIQRVSQTPSSTPLRQVNGNKPAAGAGAFENVLANERLKFSQHAQDRLAQRKMNLSDGDVAKIADAVDKAATKGSRESLVLLDNMALVVSITNRTVITAVDKDKMKENVFTNIDSAIIVD